MGSGLCMEKSICAAEGNLESRCLYCTGRQPSSLNALQVIHVLAAAPEALEDAEQDSKASGLQSNDECVQQLAPWPTTWSNNFSDRLQTMTGGGSSELNTETAAVGRMQAEMLNARLSASMAADLLTSRNLD